MPYCLYIWHLTRWNIVTWYPTATLIPPYIIHYNKGDGLRNVKASYTSVANIGNNPSSIDIQLAADEAFGRSSNKEMQLNPSKTKAMLIFQTEYLVFYCELSMLCAY